MRRFSFRLSHGQVASEWARLGSNTLFNFHLTALSVWHTSLGKAWEFGGSKEVPQLNLSSPNSYSILIAGKINIYRGTSRKQIWKRCQEIGVK